MRILLFWVLLIIFTSHFNCLFIRNDPIDVSVLSYDSLAAINWIPSYDTNTEFISEPEYIWENSTKHTMLCDRINSRYTNDTPVLVYNYWASAPFTGFGSMLHAVITLIASAVAGNYRLYFVFPQYNSLFNGCYSNYIVANTSQFNFTKRCVPMNRCFGRKWFWNIDLDFGNNSVYTSGSNIFPVRVIDNPRFFTTWDTLFSGMDSNLTLWKVRQMFIHLFVNPSPTIRHRLMIEETRILKLNHTIGLQLRMGGSVADSREWDYWGVPFSRLDDVIDQVREEIEKHHWQGDTQLYISSDSTKAIRYIQEKVNGEFPVVESSLYHRGHTRKISARSRYEESMSQVVADFYYIARSDFVIVSWQSTLGRMMCYTKDEDQCDKVLHWNSENKKVRIPEKKTLFDV